ncbi:hypothetical protein OGV95_08725 [Citrobacter sp. Cf236]|uniref:hypothetical protein n=1 Tax=Citrobacter sp. Cf236 TaxID=2985088 RepID=UPI00257909E4|nr:hypothetical protein [Citrobacter sp. Cf236]MDM3055195.1 hypothetical protein [Citrobacter sp. Cf236]
MKRRLSFKLYSLIYLMITCTVMILFAIAVTDFVIGNWLVDIWHGKVTISDYFDSRVRVIVLMGGYGAFAGVVVWLMMCRKYNIR